MFHDSFGRAANEQARHPAAAVRADHDEVDIEVVRHLDNLVKRVSHANISLCLDATAYHLLFERRLSLASCSATLSRDGSTLEWCFRWANGVTT